MAFFGQSHHMSMSTSGHHMASPIAQPAFLDVAKQQMDLITWVGTKIQEHETKIETLTRDFKALSESGPHPARQVSGGPIRGDGVSPQRLDDGHSAFTPKRWQAAAANVINVSDGGSHPGSPGSANDDGEGSREVDAAKKGDGEATSPRRRNDRKLTSQTSAKKNANKFGSNQAKMDKSKGRRGSGKSTKGLDDGEDDEQPVSPRGDEDASAAKRGSLQIKTDMGDQGDEWDDVGYLFDEGEKAFEAAASINSNARTAGANKRRSVESSADFDPFRSGDLDDIDQKLNDFSDFMQAELQRLDGAICQQMEARMQTTINEAIRTGMQEMMTEKMASFADEVKTFVDDKISTIPSGMSVMNAMGDMRETEDRVLENSVIAPLQQINVVPAAEPVKGSELQTLEPSRQVSAESTPARQLTDPGTTADSLLPSGDAGGAMVSGILPGIVASGTAAHADAPQNAAGSHQSPGSLSSATGAAPVRRNSKGGGLTIDHVYAAVQQLHGEMNRRLPTVEQALTEMKPLRLQMPVLQKDLENLSMSVMQIAQDMEDDTPAGSPLPQHEPPRKTEDEDFGLVEDDDGAGAGAHAPSKANVDDHRKSGVGTRRSVAPMAMMSAYMGTHGHSAIDNDAFEALVRRVDKCEGESKKIERCMDMEQLINILEDRVKEVDGEFRVHKKEVDFRLSLQKTEEEREAASAAKVYESWDLDNQVDVIQAVVAGEMRSVRMELDNGLKAVSAQIESQAEMRPRAISDDGLKRGSVANISSSPRSAARGRESAGENARSRSNSPTKSIEETEEKVKRLQEAYQQATLKLAGFKSASRHTEQQVAHVMEQMKKVAREVEECQSRSMRSETRLDYIAIHQAGHKEGGMEENASFGAAVKKGNAHMQAGNTRATIAAPRESHAVLKAPHGPGHHGSTIGVPTDGGQRPSHAGHHAGHGRLRRISAGVGNDAHSPAPGRLVSPASPAGHAGSSEADDINTGRIVRLGKKLNDIDGDMNGQFEAIKKEMQILSERTNMITSFLPKRLKRMVERLLLLHKKEEEDAHENEKVTSKRRGSDAKGVKISEKDPEVQSFQAEVDRERVPWQLIGEPDAKWSWCLQPRNEMGRDLARFFETLEHEREELEESVVNQVEQLRREILMRMENVPYSRPGFGGNRESNFARPEKISVAMPPERIMDSSPSSPTGKGGEPSSPRLSGRQSDADCWSPGADMDKLSRQVQRTILPQIQGFEERIERIVKDLTEVKKSQENLNERKADKEDLALIKMHITPFIKFDPKQVAVKLENLEVDGKHHLHLIDQLAEQVRKVEGFAAHRADVTKVRTEISSLKTDLQKLHGEQKETASTIFHSNRQMSTIVLDTKANLEKTIGKLEIEKVGVVDYATLVDKLSKVESSMRDNRQILSDAGGGNEVNHVVKRIILNMEDKIMILEKKCDMILEKQTSGPVQDECGYCGPPRPYTSGVADDGVAQALGMEMSTISQAVNQLRQDVNLSKVSMDQMREQEMQSTEMAQRLNILIEDGDVGTSLSLGRVQVMVAAAARQLIAGSKWVTQEMFDQRLNDMKKEFFGFMREAQTQIEDTQERVKVMYTSSAGREPKKLPNLVKKSMAQTQNGGWEIGSGNDPEGPLSGLKPKTAPALAVSVVAPLKFATQRTGQNPPNSARAAYR